MMESQPCTPDAESVKEQESPEQIPLWRRLIQPKSREIYSKIWKPVCLELVSAATFAFTAWIAQGTFSTSKVIAGLGIDASVTLTIMAVLQSLLSLMVTKTLSNVFELIQWALTARSQGLSSLNVLGLSPTTGILGSLRIIINRHSTWTERCWPLLRLGATTALWISILVPFANTSLDTVYDSVHTYKVTAGVGPFKGSYVREYLHQLQAQTPQFNYTIVPYGMQAIVYNLVMNSALSTTLSPITCSGSNCDSYLITGGLMSTTPWPPTDYPSAPVIKLPEIPACQIDFERGTDEREPFSEDDCTQFGDNLTMIGMRFCLSGSQRRPNSINAGIFVCPNGTENGQCSITNNPSSPNITTTFSIFNRKATIISSRISTEILSSSSLGDPVPYVDLNLTDYRDALNWILDYNASNIPAPTSIAGQFWSGQKQMESAYWSTELTHTFQSILAFPFWAFQDNNFGNINENRQIISTRLPIQFYTDASLATPRRRIVISFAMLIIFMVLQGIVHFFTWGVFLWLVLVRPDLPKISSYPLLDYALKTRHRLIKSPKSKLQPSSPLPVTVDGVRAGDQQFLSILPYYQSMVSSESPLMRYDAMAGQEMDQASQGVESSSSTSSEIATSRPSLERESFESHGHQHSTEVPFRANTDSEDCPRIIRRASDPYGLYSSRNTTFDNILLHNDGRGSFNASEVTYGGFDGESLSICD